MTRNFKLIGLALLLAAIAMGVLAATGAFAEEEEEGGGNNGTLTAASYPATLDGTDKEGELNAFTLFGLKIECIDSSYSGELASASEKFTIMPSYNNEACFEEGRKATITTNGCGYEFTIRHTTTANPKYKENYFATTHIKCPASKDIEIHVYEAGDNENVKFCEITIKEQTRNNRAKIQNEAIDKDTGDIKLEYEVQEITATKSSGAGGCGNGTTSFGRYDLGITIQGTTKAGAANSLKVTD